MKTLPYFKWYPADAEMDAKYRAMDDAERGFYLTCLNYAWINGGLPSNPQERARALGRRRSECDKRWLRVGLCFQPSDNSPAILVNPRQERERLSAISKSDQASDAVRNRERKKHARSTSDTTSDTSSDDLRTLGRADCVSDSDSEGSKKKPSLQLFSDFQPFWERWCKLTGRKQREEDARRAWISVPPEDIPAAMACLERYGKSDEVARGVVTNPDKWIYDQARSKWGGDWPVARKNPNSASKTDRAMDIFMENMADKMAKERP